MQNTSTEYNTEAQSPLSYVPATMEKHTGLIHHEMVADIKIRTTNK